MSQTKKIFIFDDDQDILELCIIILESKGYEVSTSETTNNIIEKVNSFNPDIIFMDNWIPDIGGAEATRLLKADKQLKHIPVIYFSANNDIHTLAKNAGADNYLPKPFNINELENMVEKTLAE